MEKRETHFVVWSDGSVTVIYRDKTAKGELSDYCESHRYTATQAQELVEQISKLTAVRG